jgi:hypothetical protein
MKLTLILALVAVFLPLFPLSTVHNLLLTRLRAPVVRSVVLLLWPQIGVTLLDLWQLQIPGFVTAWAVASAAFYALRLLTVRDLGLWAGFLATSAVALIWGMAAHGADITELRLFAFWFSLPPALLVLLTGPIVQRLGASYAGLFAGFAQGQPRLAGVLTVVVLSTIATPPFPGFFALLDLLRRVDSAAALGVLGVWLIWGWAATRILQGFVAGSGRKILAADFAPSVALTYIGALAVLTLAGVQFIRGGL